MFLSPVRYIGAKNEDHILEENSALCAFFRYTFSQRSAKYATRHCNFSSYPQFNPHPQKKFFKKYSEF